jgi:hypothetical protein
VPSRSWIGMVVALATLAASPGPAAGSSRVVTFPGPAWRAASPGTGITFHGITAAALRRLRVSGSITGTHAGRLRPLRLGRGAVFTPATPFRPGERVSVRGGAPRVPQFAFTIARPVTERLGGEDRHARRARGTASRGASATGAGGGVGTCTPRRRRFRTRPRFRPVGICVIRPPDATTTRGRILVTPKTRPNGQQALMILRNDGRLLWYVRRRGYVRDLRTVRFRGRRLLAFFQFRSRRRAHYVLMNRRYRVVRRIFPGNGLRMNMHDLQLTRRGTAYFAAYQAVRDPVRGLVTDYVLQERDLRTRQVLFEWHSLDHVRPSASYKPRPTDGTSWDYFHGNSIDPPRRRHGMIVVSARNTSAVYGIHRRTGSVRWTFGGRRDRFGLVRRRPEWQFCGQHDVRRLPGGDLLLFDDGGRGVNPRACPVHPARVMRFRLHRRRGTVELVRAIPSGPASATGAGFFPGGLGSARRQPNGDVFVSWGTAGVLSDVRPGGEVRLALRLGRYSYRAVRSRWAGRPRGRPAVAARRRRDGAIDVWASWNGATHIRRWRVLAGRSRRRLMPVGTRVRFAGLETPMRVRTRRQLVAVRAFAANGRAVGRSRVVRVARVVRVR